MTTNTKYTVRLISDLFLLALIGFISLIVFVTGRDIPPHSKRFFPD